MIWLYFVQGYITAREPATPPPFFFFPQMEKICKRMTAAGRLFRKPLEDSNLNRDLTNNADRNDLRLWKKQMDLMKKLTPEIWAAINAYSDWSQLLYFRNFLPRIYPVEYKIP